jgi:SAM-dependent methyltransferase
MSKTGTGVDTFGRALLDWVNGGTDPEIVERGDGLTELGPGPEGYLTPFRQWPLGQKEATRLVWGRVADLGGGCGRVSKYLQDRGHEVVTIDSSTLALRAARLLGVKRVERGTLEDFAREIHRFDTVMLFGNNLGAFGRSSAARRALKLWSRRANSDTRLLVESTDPLRGGTPVVNRAYALENIRRGRPPGQCEMRIWYGRECSEWIPWFFVSRRDLRTLVAGTGWRVTTILGSGPSAPFVAVLELSREP